jgi:hypothetical protein
MSGWLSITRLLEKKRGKPTEFGGLVEISETGARLYLTNKLAVGTVVPMVIQSPKGKMLNVPLKILWVKKDEIGNVETFDARIKLMQELIRNDVKVDGITYGYLYGGTFLNEAEPEGIRIIERYLNEQRDPGHETYTKLEVPDLIVEPRSFNRSDSI